MIVGDLVLIKKSEQRSLFRLSLKIAIVFVKIELVFGLGKVLSLSVDLACILNVYALFIAVLWAAIRI